EPATVDTQQLQAHRTTGLSIGEARLRRLPHTYSLFHAGPWAVLTIISISAPVPAAIARASVGRAIHNIGLRGMSRRCRPLLRARCRWSEDRSELMSTPARAPTAAAISSSPARAEIAAR